MIPVALPSADGRRRGVRYLVLDDESRSLPRPAGIRRGTGPACG